MKITDPIEQQQLVQEIRDLLASFGYEDTDVRFVGTTPKEFHHIGLRGANVPLDFENDFIRFESQFYGLMEINDHYFKKSFTNSLFYSLLKFGYICSHVQDNQDIVYSIELMNEKEITYILENTPSFEKESYRDAYQVAKETSRFPLIPIPYPLLK